MSTLYSLEKILEESVKKHGEKPLTNKWLLNIVKMSLRRAEAEREEEDLRLDMLAAEVEMDEAGDR